MPNIIAATVTVTFDPEKVSVHKLVAALEGKGIEVSGEPKVIK